jgi:hypothetical protein
MTLRKAFYASFSVAHASDLGTLQREDSGTVSSLFRALSPFPPPPHKQYYRADIPFEGLRLTFYFAETRV